MPVFPGGALMGTLQKPSGLLSRAWRWIRERQVVRSCSRRLHVAATASLGEKRFVALVQMDGLEFLVGGGASNVVLLAELNGKEQFKNVLEDRITHHEEVATAATEKLAAPTMRPKVQNFINATAKKIMRPAIEHFVRPATRKPAAQPAVVEPAPVIERPVRRRAPAVKSAAKPIAKPAAKAAAKPAAKPAVRQAPKPAAKPAAKTGAKSPAPAATKSTTKKPAERAVAKPAPTKTIKKSTATTAKRTGK